MKSSILALEFINSDQFDFRYMEIITLKPLLSDNIYNDRSWGYMTSGNIKILIKEELNDL